ncbi:MAG TPA: M23 family metallopeptidase [Candidatus Cloacimonadota bacterium]|nr:M23 family metallopeptidase [Candidatus Cloacimonadota bacterium]
MNQIKYIGIMCIILIILIGSGCTKKTIIKTEQTEKQRNKKTILIPAGSSLYSELQKTDMSASLISELITALSNEVDIETIQPGSQFELIFDSQTNEFKEIAYLESVISSHIIRYQEGQFNYEYVEKETEKRLRIVEGYLDGTLNQALNEKKIESSVKNEISQTLSSKINFRTSARKGDYFKVLLEENYYLNQKLPGTKLLYVAYEGKTTGKAEAYRYEESDKKSAFNGMYMENGLAMLSAALRLPLDRIQITSRFGYRIHPISRRKKMHNGIDYRASTGTPVYSIAAGTVIRANWYGGYGKTVEIRHQDGHISQYAHLHRINVKHGQSVKAGSIIGSVGSTGYSTGPHLHFGIRNKKSWINPQSFKMTSATKLNSARLQAFKTQIQIIKEKINNRLNEHANPLEMTVLERYRRDNNYRF